MASIPNIVIVSTLILLTIMQLNIILVHADSSELSYCANGEGKDGIKVKICSVDEEKCEKNAKENDIKLKCDTQISVANIVFFVKFNLPFRRINRMTVYIAFVFFACIFDTISIVV